MKIILATSNSGKLREIESIFNNDQIIFKSLNEFSIKQAPETSLSFIENAIEKARYASKQTNLPAIADDSGLQVACLNGQPGIHSARFAGDNASDQENINLLLEKMSTIASSSRQGQFRCALAFVRHHLDPVPIIAEGYLDGLITEQQIGNNGFGYDSVFMIPTLNQTLAQMSAEEKNSISHRFKAINKMVGLFNENRVFSELSNQPIADIN